jgi:GNAT superfamily N-acetyltransferase
VRAAGAADLPALTMLSAANRMHHAHAGALGERRARYERLLAADNALVLLAEAAEPGADPVPVACFAAIFYPARPDAPARAYIEDAFVVKRWRRRGVLGAMLAELLDACRARGIDQVDVDYLADNPEGVAAWTRLGFSPRSVRATGSVERLGRR